MSVTLASGATKPSVDFDQEVRFAVVMYGGSSLAIYINGVAQELLRLVRATAPEFGGTSNGRQAHLADEELQGSERVYRRLGRLLRRQRLPSAKVDEDDSNAGNSGPIRTRFVVDILTGTSAGGINAVFLAKALANNQNIDKLKNLWVTEGDIGVLINDTLSYSGLNLDEDEGEPWSLLNSRRMYLALLKALRGMDEDKEAAPPGTSPLVDELDLYVTATDMFGKPIEMRLADDVVSEFRHRNVFQFRYRSGDASNMVHSDFGKKVNAFLAFAARATSAHQAAFSPVRLKDVSLITAKHPMDPLGDEFSAEAEELHAFYRDYLLQRAASANKDPEALAKAFQDVWFVDGGTLDNKPFSFVVEELPLRHADTFVDRKLLYIEPSPELSEFRKAPEKRPQIVGNALAALSSLPRYETIVQDLNRLLERNRLIERLDNIMRGMEQDIIYGSIQRHTRDEFLKLLQDPEKLKEWLKSKGSSWGSYLRLRVGEVTDDLTLLVARAAGFSEESDEFLAIRYLVREWRDTHYHPNMEEGKLSQLQFLVEFDLLWAMRRVRFVLKKLNELSCLSEHDEDSRRIARAARGRDEPEVWPAEGEVEDFRKAVQDLRDKLNKVLVTLRGERRTLWSRDETNPFRNDIKALEITSNDLLQLLQEPTDNARREKAKALLQTPLKEPPADATNLRTRTDAIGALTENVKTKLGTVINTAREHCSNALRPLKDDAAEAGRHPRWERFLREILWYYYIYFEDFDQVSYPILYSTAVGEEADVIDVFRVSPLDATALISEKDQNGIQKLAGTTLGNFGAFFERKFRINDIMWGRLDGAERVIAALLPSNPDLRRELTEEAHREIIKDEARNRIDLARAHAKQVFGSLSDREQRAKSNVSLLEHLKEALDLMASNQDCDAKFDAIRREASGLPSDSLWRIFLESFLSEFRPFADEYIKPTVQGTDPLEAFRKWFNAQYEDGRTFTQHATLDAAIRINKVLGDMALGYFPPDKKMSWKRWLAMRFGAGLRMFTEAAILSDGEAGRKQRTKLVVSYVFSFVIALLVCLPAVLLVLSPTNPWSMFGMIFLIVTVPFAVIPAVLHVLSTANAWSIISLIILIVTVPLAVIPLTLTFAYNLVWLLLRRELEERLLSARKT